MKSKIKWTNKSVLELAQDTDPIAKIESLARTAVLRARDEGWTGPPYDPIDLAERLGIRLEPVSNIPDARTIPDGDQLVIQFNPIRPRGRLRFSIAHEIAHSFFPDCADAIRNRGGSHEVAPDDWQLEVLCNIGAAELLMPAGSFSDLPTQDLNIRSLLELRKKYDVSTEALLIRIAKLSKLPCAAFCASKHRSGFKLDYIIPSAKWAPRISSGQAIPSSSLIAEVNAIGFSTHGDETWGASEKVHIECTGLAPYPDQFHPRIVGIIFPTDEFDENKASLREVFGDALDPRGNGKKLIVHVVPNKKNPWGGRGFASSLRKAYPQAWQDFSSKVADKSLLSLGSVIITSISENLSIAHIIAQEGFGQSQAPRLRYHALEAGLSIISAVAKEQGLSIHMPRIGTGHAGGDWSLIKELIHETLVSKQIPVTVYALPPRA